MGTKAKIENELGETIEVIKIEEEVIDFKTSDGMLYWAKLTSAGKLKKNSIRIARF